jgi:hypothetical protein
MPAEIREAIPQLRSLLSALDLPVFNVPGVEADDVLGTLAVRGVQVQICSFFRLGFLQQKGIGGLPGLLLNGLQKPISMPWACPRLLCLDWLAPAGSKV